MNFTIDDPKTNWGCTYLQRIIDKGRRDIAPPPFGAVLVDAAERGELDYETALYVIGHLMDEVKKLQPTARRGSGPP